MNEQGVKQGCTPGPPFFDMSEQLFVARLTCDSCRYSMFTHISVFYITYPVDLLVTLYPKGFMANINHGSSDY